MQQSASHWLPQATDKITALHCTLLEFRTGFLAGGVYRDQGDASISRISAAFQLLILTSTDEVMNCHVYPSYLHRNITPEHYCLPSPCFAVAPCLFKSATSKMVWSETVFHTLCNQIHCYSGILKIHIITKIYTSIRCETVYRPALQQTTILQNRAEKNYKQKITLLEEKIEESRIQMITWLESRAMIMGWRYTKDEILWTGQRQMRTIYTWGGDR